MSSHLADIWIVSCMLVIVTMLNCVLIFFFIVRIVQFLNHLMTRPVSFRLWLMCFIFYISVHFMFLFFFFFFFNNNNKGFFLLLIVGALLFKVCSNYSLPLLQLHNQYWRHGYCSYRMHILVILVWNWLESLYTLIRPHIFPFFKTSKQDVQHFKVFAVV